MKSYSFLHVNIIETVKIIAEFFGGGGGGGGDGESNIYEFWKTNIYEEFFMLV